MNNYKKLLEQQAKLIEQFNSKWNTICQEEYNSNYEELYNKKLSDMFEDLKPIWETSYKISLIKEQY
jgi:hypothetical protein